MSGKSASEELVRIGYLRKPHGLNGFLKMTCLTDFASERFQPGSECMLLKEGNPALSAVIAECKPMGSELLIRFEGRDSKEEVVALRDTYLCVEYSDRMSLKKDDFYVDQLIGLDVFTASSLCLGRVMKVDELPANPVLEIHSQDSKPLLIPFVKALVSSVDLEAGKLVLSREFSIQTIG